MPLIILMVLVVVGMIALVVFRARSIRNDRRRQDEDSKR